MQNEEKPQQKDEQALLSIGEAAEFTGVSIDTLRRWEKRGRLVAFRSPGGHRYFEKEKLKDLFNLKYAREPKPAILKPEKEELPPTPLPPEQEIPAQSPASAAETILIPMASPTPVESRPEKPAPPATQEEATIPTVVSASSSESFQARREEPSAHEKDLGLGEEKPQVKTQEQLLKSLFDTPHQEKRKLSKTQMAAIAGLIVFAIIDLFLLYVWFATPKLLSPIP